VTRKVVGSVRCVYETGLVKPSASVVENQPLVHVQYDAATIEFAASTSGRLGDLLVAVGEEVPINTVLCELAPRDQVR